MKSKFVEFSEPSPSESGKTMIWYVSGQWGAELGEIKWYGRWRAYTFHPAGRTIFEQHCLRSIAKFCEVETEKLRKTWKRKKK